MAKASGGAEFEHHVVGVRLRVTGAGNLDMTLESYDAVKTQALVPLPMHNPNQFEPTRLSNFQSQRTRLVISVDQIDEWFSIHRIIIYAKPVAIEYPSGTGE